MAAQGQSTKQRKQKMKIPCIATLVQITVLVWSAGILTAGWLGAIKNADTTFTAGIFTSILANFGVRKREEDEKLEPESEEKAKTKADPKVQTKVEPKPEPASTIRSSKTQAQP
jgi:hypothetical protein